jgi:hypothetical protein
MSKDDKRLKAAPNQAKGEPKANQKPPLAVFDRLCPPLKDSFLFLGKAVGRSGRFHAGTRHIEDEVLPHGHQENESGRLQREKFPLIPGYSRIIPHNPAYGDLFYFLEVEAKRSRSHETANSRYRAIHLATTLLARCDF